MFSSFWLLREGISHLWSSITVFLFVVSQALLLLFKWSTWNMSRLFFFFTSNHPAGQMFFSCTEPADSCWRIMIPPLTCTFWNQTFPLIFFWTGPPPLPSSSLLPHLCLFPTWLLTSSPLFWLLLFFLHLSPCRQHPLSELYPPSPHLSLPFLLFLRWFLQPPGGAVHCGSACQHPEMFLTVSVI